jgi:hypothetical protein
MHIRLVLAASGIALAAFGVGSANASTSNFLNFHSFQDQHANVAVHADGFTNPPWTVAAGSERSTDFIANGFPRVAFTDPGPAANGTGRLNDLVVTSAVPEPATWAMMLVGFGGLGAAMRTSRRAKAAAATA